MIEIYNPNTKAFKRVEIEKTLNKYAVVLLKKKYIKVPYDNLRWVSADFHFETKKKKRIKL